MFLKNKIVPVALGAALLGGSVGALVMRQSNTAEVASAHTAKTAPAATTQNLVPASNTESQALTASKSDNECFRDGFAEGVRAAHEEGLAPSTETASASTTTSDRVAYQPASNTRTRTVRSRRGSSQRQVYYDYNRPQKRSFWQKHRDKLTVGIGAGSGALVGGLVGGKKGALIGALAGGGGAALYTYKLRNRDRRY